MPGAYAAVGSAWEALQLAITDQGLSDFFEKRIRGQADSVRELAQWIRTAGDQWREFKSNFSGVGDQFNEVLKAIQPVVPYLGDFAIAALAVAGTAAGLSLAASGLGLVAGVVFSPVVLGIAAVAAGAVLIRENWEGVTAWWAGLWEGLDGDIGAFSVRFIESIGGLAADFAAEGLVIAKGFVSSISIGVRSAIADIDWPSSTEIASGSAGLITAYYDLAAMAWGALIDGINSGVSSLGSDTEWPSSVQLVNGAANFISGFAEIAIAAAGALVSGISRIVVMIANDIDWPAVADLVRGAGDFIADFAKIAVSAVTGLIDSIGEDMGRLPSNIDWPSASDILSSAGGMIRSFVSVAGETIAALVGGISDGVRTLAKDIDWPDAATLGAGAANLLASFASLAFDVVAVLFRSISSGVQDMDIEWPTAAEIIRGASSFVSSFAGAATSFATAFVVTLTARISQGMQSIDWPDFDDIKAGAKVFIDGFGDIALEAVTALADGLRGIGGSVLGGIRDGLSGTADAVKNELVGLFDGVPFIGETLSNQLRDVARSVEPDAKMVGENIVEGTEEGIFARIGNLFGAGEEAGEEAIAGLNKGAGNRSPSIYGYQAGSFIVEGAVNGVNDSAGTLAAATEEAASDAMRSFERIMSGLDDQITTFTGVTEGARKYGDQWDKLNESQRNSIEDKEEILRGLEAEKELRDELGQGIQQSIVNADSIKDAFGNIGDFMKDWLKEKIAYFAANQVTAFLGLGDSGGAGLGDIASLFTSGSGGIGEMLSGVGSSISSAFGGLFGGGGAASAAPTFATAAPTFSGAGSAGAGAAASTASGTIGAFASTAASFAGIAAAGFVVGEALGDLTGAANDTAVGIGTGLGAAIGSVVPVIGTFVGGAIGAVVGSAFGGDWEQVATATTINLSKLGEVTGTAVQEFEKERSFWRGTVSRSVDVEVGQDVTDQVQQYFDTLASGINSAARVLGASSAGNILDGFSASFTSRTEAEFAEGLEDSTISAYRVATSRMGPLIQQFIGQNVDLMTAPLEDIEALFQNMTTTVGTMLPAFDSLGISLGVNGDAAAVNALNLSGAFGGLDNAMAGISVLLNSEFLPATTQVNTALNNATTNVDDWNESLGLADGAQIRTTEGIVQYIDAQDLGTEAGIQATIAAISLGESIQLVEAESVRAAQTMGVVTDATNLLNLRFDETSPLAGTAADSIVQLMGGLNNFSAATGDYYDKFFTDTERTQLELASSAAAVQVWTGTLSDTQLQLAGITDGTIDTNAEFRRYVESLDLTTEAGQLAFAQAIEIADSFDAVTASGSSMEDIISQLPPELQNAFQAMVNDAQAASDGLAEESARISESIDEVADSMERAGPIVNGLWTDQATQNLNDWWQAAQGSSLGLQVQNSNASGSFRTGLLNVPSDGFIAELHQGEMVTTADVSSQLRSMGITHNSIPDNLGASSSLSIQPPPIASNDSTRFAQVSSSGDLVAIRQAVDELKSVMISAAGDSTQQRREINASLNSTVQAIDKFKEEARTDARKQLNDTRLGR